jgi:hypothetical protein
MKFAAIAICLCCFLSEVSAQIEERMRVLFFQCGTPGGVQTYYQEASQLNNAVALYRGYKGSATTMLAGTKEGVHEKFSVFNQGKDELEAAIAMEPSNYELRFLRYAVQAEVPMIVGYKGQLKEDLEYLIKGFESGAISSKYWYWQNALAFIQKSDDKSAEQWQRLSKFVSQ